MQRAGYFARRVRPCIEGRRLAGSECILSCIDLNVGGFPLVDLFRLQTGGGGDSREVQQLKAEIDPLPISEPPSPMPTSPMPTSPCVDVLGVVVDVAAARMSGRSRRAPAGNRQCAHRGLLTRFRPVPLLLRAGPPPRCLGCVRARARGSASRGSAPALADKPSDPAPVSSG